MSTIVTRAGKGSPLTNTEVDSNFTNLNSDKAEKASNLSDLTNVANARSNLGLGDMATQNKASLAGPVAISDSSASPALKITQTGSGNALVVEDVASDTTPFAIDQNGNVSVGIDGSILDGVSGSRRPLQVASQGNAGMNIGRWSADTNSPVISFIKSRGAAINTQTVVLSGDEVGRLSFAGTDGTGAIPTASIQAFIDGTPGTNDMPGRLSFSTTADGASSPTERMRIDSAGNVGIGIPSEANVILSVRGAQRNHRHVANDAAAIFHANVKARGTVGAQLTVNNNDGIFSYQAYAYDGTGDRQAAAIVAQVDGVPASSTVPGRLLFSTTSAGTSQVPLERMRIDSSGNVLIKSAAGLGYGAGAGGTVTQATSKSTAVTLNKPCGQITMNNAALAAGATVGFIMNNSLISASDIVLVMVSDGAVARGSYEVIADSAGLSGAVGIFVKNISAVSLSEAVKLNFAIIKGATS